MHTFPPSEQVLTVSEKISRGKMRKHVAFYIQNGSVGEDFAKIPDTRTC
jgi:hypothetical protein